MQYSKIKFAVGLFTITLFIIIFTYLYIILEEKGLFNKRYNYYFNTKSATYFNVGMPLKFSGFNIGVIDDISLKDDGTVHMIFSVDEENKKWIREETILKMNKPLIGSPFIEIQSNLNKPHLAAGETLQIVQSDDINDMISKMEPVIEKIIKIIDNIYKISATFAREDSKLNKTFSNLDKFTQKLANESLLKTVTGDVKSQKEIENALSKLNASMQDIKEITQNINAVSRSINKDLVEPSSQAVKEVNAIMKDIKHKLDSLDGLVSSVGSFDKEIVDVKEQVSLAIEKSNEIMSKVDSLMQDEERSEVVLP